MSAVFGNYTITKDIKEIAEKSMTTLKSKWNTLRCVAQYILLIRYTDQGIRNVKDTMNRAAMARKEAENLGGKLTVYWTLGKYDIVCILEAPNDEAAMQLGLKFGSLGNIRTQTLRAFTEQETAGIISKLGAT